MFVVLIDLILLIFAISNFIIDITHNGFVGINPMIIGTEITSIILVFFMLFVNMFFVEIKRFLKKDEIKQLIRDVLKNKEH